MLKKAFSLIEVLVFVTILSLFFVAAMAITVFSLRNMKSQEYKILATHFAEEGLEWLRSEKESDWSQFIVYDTSPGTGTTYCLNSLDWNNPNSCSGYSLGTPNIFKRELVIRNNGSPVNQVDVNLTVSWIEGNNVFTVPVNTIFKLSE